MHVPRATFRFQSCNATASRHNGYGPCRLSSASVVVVDQRREQAEGALMATGLY